MGRHRLAGRLRPGVRDAYVVRIILRPSGSCIELWSWLGLGLSYAYMSHGEADGLGIRGALHASSTPLIHDGQGALHASGAPLINECPSLYPHHTHMGALHHVSRCTVELARHEREHQAKKLVLTKLNENGSASESGSDSAWMLPHGSIELTDMIIGEGRRSQVRIATWLQQEAM